MKWQEIEERDGNDFFLLDRAPPFELNPGLRVTLELLRGLFSRLDFFCRYTLPLLSGYRREGILG